jgi:hypothetical protein
MYYEPDTLWGRTIEGDEEVTKPQHGLSLVQRRMLRDLGKPRTFATIAARYGMEAPRLEHELIRLAEHRLVAFQRPGSPQPRTAPRIHLTARPGTAAALPGGPWKPPAAVYLGAIALGMALVMILVA